MSKVIKITFLSILILMLVSVMIYFMGNNYSFKVKKSKLQYEISYKLEYINKINIDVRSIDIDFKKSEDNNFNIKVYATNKDRVTVDSKNNILNVKENKSKACHVFCFTTGHTKAEIYVPEEYLGDINLKLTSGDITSEIDNINNYKFKLTSGDIKLKNVGSIEGKFTSGDIEIDNVTKYINVEGTSGDIEIDNMSLEKDSKIKITSGDVDINKANDIYVETHVTSGDVKVKNKDRFASHVLNIKATSGDITVK